MKSRNIFLMLTLMLLVALIAACSSPTPAVQVPAPVTVVNLQPTAVPPTSAPTAIPVAAQPASTFTDAFAYCTAVGNIDAADARYTGAKLPDNVANGLIQAAKISPDMPKDILAQSSFWRCMNAKVYACTVGANLPCQEKANADKTPTAAMNDFCKANPSADIPAAVTGRATVYTWKCVSGKAQVDKEVFKADARGFIADFWYELAPGTAAASSSASAVGMANPASVYCGQNGGKTDIRKTASGEVGYCVFPDKSECEEWAFMRGECKSGAKAPSSAASMANPASVFCGQNGGKTDIRKTASGEVGYCVFSDKSECEEWAFMRGECKPGAKATTVTKSENGKTVQVASGHIVEVVLEGAPGSTGYAWSFVSGNNAVLKPQFDPAKPLDQYQAGVSMPGAPGKFVYKFQAVSAGSAALKFVNKQSWVQDDPKAETFSVTVTVK